MSLSHAGIDERWVVVVADRCTDRTVERARRALGSAGEVICIDVRSAGAARREGVARMLAHWGESDPARIWLANTDADTFVSEEWIAVQLAFADQGITAVAGIVHLHAGASASVHDVFRTTYLTTPQGTHSHVHGANLSVRADAYVDVGGWSDLPLAEDHCLWARLRRRGWRVSSPVSSVVATSPRLEGRAKGGFADALKARVEALHAVAG
ncbi:MAG: glycosyltransferase [Steroidobacteraceae bacterium]